MTSVRLPRFLAEHPIEGLVAVGLLLGLLFISADGTRPEPSGALMQMAVEKN